MSLGRNKKVLVAVSGGVDSAVAAKILIDQGYDVSGIFLNFWRDNSSPKSENKCCSLEAQLDAKKVCLKLGIPFYTFDFSSKFKKAVVDNFLNEYSQGKTPNPCVICNREIKIGGLLKYAQGLGFDFLATGHYVKVIKEKGQVKMMRGKDKNKDQSYFLYSLNTKQLAKLIFPLGDLRKIQVRKIARQAGLAVATKSDSQEICFISGKRHNDFLKKYLKLKKGEIRLWPSGEKLSEHQGLPLYTIGQRRGVEIGGTGPYYAAKFDNAKNILYVVKNFSDPILYQKSMEVENLNFLKPYSKWGDKKADILIRYRHKTVGGIVSYNKKRGIAVVDFFRRQRAITPGQSAVFYNKNEVLGGGVIKKTE